MSKTVSKAKAERVLQAVADYLNQGRTDGLFVKPGEDEGFDRGSWVICWEGSGFDCWPALVTEAAFHARRGHLGNRPASPEQKAFLVAGVDFEAYTSWGLHVYPDGE